MLCLPYALIGLGSRAGELVDKAMINSLGASVIAAFGVANEVATLFAAFPRIMSANMCMMVAKSQGEDQKVNAITTTATLITLAISLCFSLLLFIFHGAIASFFSTGDEVTENLISNLLLLRGFSVPLEALTLIQTKYLQALRKNKQLFWVNIIFYVALIGGDAIVLLLGLGGEEMFIATIIAYIIYTISLYGVSGIKIGKPSKSAAKELMRVSMDMLSDKLCKRIANIAQTKIATTFGTEVYALVTVVYSIYSIYDDTGYNLGEGWSVYVCEWLSGKRDEARTIYTRRKDIIRQTKYFSVVSLISLVLFFFLSFYIMWFLFGRAFSWNECKYNLCIVAIEALPYMSYINRYNLLRGAGKTQYLRWISVIGGLIVRIPIQLIGVFIFVWQIGAIAIGLLMDYTVRAIYLQRQIRKSEQDLKVYKERY